MRTRPNDQVVTYLVFVRKWTSAGPLPVTTWHPDQLESGAATLVVEPERGYDFILKASVRAEASMGVRFDFSVGEPREYQVDLPISEGSVVERKWTLVVRS
jgi:hypothetical protein